MPYGKPQEIYRHPATIPAFVRVVWPSSQSFVEAATSEEMEEIVKNLQLERYWDTPHFRIKMAERALEWSWTEIDIDGTAQDFLQELERAQFFLLGLHSVKENRLSTDNKVHKLPEGFRVKAAKPPIKIKDLTTVISATANDPWGF